MALTVRELKAVFNKLPDDGVLALRIGCGAALELSRECFSVVVVQPSSAEPITVRMLDGETTTFPRSPTVYLDFPLGVPECVGGKQ
jgi:hypothetical protein